MLKGLDVVSTGMAKLPSENPKQSISKHHMGQAT
jgi:hypothetical protein